jgi:hypothetical protein
LERILERTSWVRGTREDSWNDIYDPRLENIEENSETMKQVLRDFEKFLGQ